MKTARFTSALALALAFSTAALTAQDWTRFHGPNGTGISDAKNLPVKFTKQDINWKVALPGIGHSSPVLWGDKIFLTTTPDKTSGDMSLRCFNAKDGAQLWERAFKFSGFRQHRLNSFASSTPAADAERVYVMWSTPEQYLVIAFDHAGNQLWERDLGSFQSQHGLGVSPMIYDGKVIVANDQRGAGFLIALDAKSGKTVWKTARKASDKTAYSTPCVYAPKGRKPSLIFNSYAYGITAVDPDTGKMLWTYDDAFDKRSCSSPLIGGGVIIGSCGSGGGGDFVTAIRPGNEITKEQPQLAWQLRRAAPYVPTGVYRDGHFYLVSDSGFASCVEAANGKVKWSERLNAGFYGSPVWADGKIYCVSTQGEVIVFRADPGAFEVLARNDLDEAAQTTPAISHGKMYIRTVGHLMSIGG